MSDYTITISFTADEEAEMQNIATKAEKTVKQILDEQADERIMGQCVQWIKDEAKAEFNKLDAADALKKLKS